MIKKVIKTSLEFFVNGLRFYKYLGSIILHLELKNHIQRQFSGKVAVLANGPSLKEVLPKLNSNSFADTDFIVLNFFAECKEFWEIKPKHYCLADPMFYGYSHREEQVRKLFVLLEKVDWEMNIYVIARNFSHFLAFSNLKNNSIKVVPLNSQDYTGYPSLRNMFYKHGLACPPLQTVAIMAIYVAINSGYSHIDLYGVDHTFFDSLCVDDNNHLCNRDKHFYDKGEAVLKPIVKTYNGEIFRISDYVICIGKMFKSHDLLSDYSNYMNVEILNCTSGSMIDSYKRASQK